MSTIKQLHELAGVMSCLLEHETKSTSYKMQWLGPQITQGLWNDILAFLRHGYETTKSECQLRLYLNPSQKLWGAFAHPQKAGTGMTTETLKIEETPVQTIERCVSMGDSEPSHWLVAGTVHSHCSSSAFQSGTDEHDERNSRWGLHITVGHIDSDSVDLHCRFYVGGVQFNPDMSWFWNIDDAFAGASPLLRKLLDGKADDLARQLMSVAPPKDWEVPSAWKDNLIEVKREPVKVWSRPAWMDNQTVSERSYDREGPFDYEYDLHQACRRLVNFVKENPISLPKAVSLAEYLEYLQEEAPLICELINVCYEEDVSLNGLVGHIEDMEALSENQTGQHKLGLPDNCDYSQ